MYPWLVPLLQPWRWLREILLVLPAVISAFCMLAISLLLIVPDDYLFQWRRSALRQSVAEHNDSVSILHYNVLLEHEPDNQELQFGLAICLARTGRVPAAMVILNRLTPEVGLGYPPAHVAAAELLAESPTATVDQLKVAQSHLERVLESQTQNARVQELLGLVYCRTHQWQKVQEPPGQRWKRLDPWSVQLARQFVHSDKAAAQLWARHCVEYSRTELAKDRDNSSLRLDCAESQIILRDFAAAVTVLKEGWDRSPLDAYHNAIGVTIELWLGAEPNLLKGPQLGVIEDFLKSDPHHTTVLALILSQLDVMVEKDPAAELPVIPATLPTLHLEAPPAFIDGSQPPETPIKPRLPATVPSVAATQPVSGDALRSLCNAVLHARRMNSRAAQDELALSLKYGDERMVAVAASLACVWASASHGDPAGATLLLRSLQDLRPDSPIVWRALAVILIQQQRWSEAGTVLEKCLAMDPADTWAQKCLAQAHDNLGQTDTAPRLRSPASTMPAP